MPDACGEAPEVTRKRANYLPRPCLFTLHHACVEISLAYDCFGVYLVGSVIIKPDYRDVDIRCIMDDKHFDTVFPKNADGVRPLWRLSCLALSLWLQKLTDLPIDFQFQKQSLANAKHRGERQALGYPDCIGGDAVD